MQYHEIAVTVKITCSVCHGVTTLKSGPVAQSVASPNADQGISISTPALSHTFVEVDHEIISTVILLLPLILIQEGLLSVTSEHLYTKY